MPGLLSGYQEGRASARTADIQQQRTDELKAQNAWDRDFKTHKGIMDFGAKLPISQRPDYYKKAFGNKSPALAEFYSSASQEQLDAINKATNEMNTKRQKGEDVSDSIAKLEYLGAPKAVTDQYKDANKVDVEQRKKEKHDEYVQQAYDIYRSGGEVTDDEVGIHASILKADPTALAEGAKLWESEKKMGGGGADNEFQLWKSNHPSGTLEDYLQLKAKYPTKSIRESVGDTIDDAMIDFVEDFKLREGREPDATERKALRLEAADTIKRRGAGATGDIEAAKQAVKVLPDLREKAQKAHNSKKRMIKMTELLDSGVTGKPGQFKKALAGWLEFFPEYSKEKIDNYSDAQLFHLLGRMMTGPMRLDIVGPGPVSETEQKLWDTMSGGGGAAEPAARELLRMYMDVADESVDYYNTSRDAASKGSPGVSLKFQRIGGKKKKSAQEGLRDKYDY